MAGVITLPPAGPVARRSIPRGRACATAALRRVAIPLRRSPGGTVRIELAYGRTRLTAELPDDADVVEPRELPGLAHAAGRPGDALRPPLSSAPGLAAV